MKLLINGHRIVYGTFWRKGASSRVYLSDEFPDKVVIVEKIGSNQKEVAWLAQNHDKPNPHLPLLLRLGQLPDERTVYTCPRYRPLRRFNTTDQGELLLLDYMRRRAMPSEALTKCHKGKLTGYEYESQMMTEVGIAYDMRESTRPKEAWPMGDALRSLLGTAADYGCGVRMDLAHNNMLRDDQGRLVLMDVIVPEPTPQ